MDKRFFNLFHLTEAEAIALLDTPLDQLQAEDSRYIAAAHLVNFPTEESKQALIRAVQQKDPSLDNRIVRRKAVESLGRLQAQEAFPAIVACLTDPDPYLVENSVWAIGELGTEEDTVLATITQLLEKPDQSHRVIIQILRKLGYRPALPAIQSFTTVPDPSTASAAIAAVAALSGDYSQISQIVALLHHKQVMVRRLAIQDLIDAQYGAALPEIARCPVSQVFRLRGIRLLAEQGGLSFTEVQPYLESTLYDHPSSLQLLHRYDQVPSLEVLIHDLYDTDFGRCYLATHLILQHYEAAAPAALFATYEEEAHTDYGAHFHVMKLMGWLRHLPAYDLLVTALYNTQPQFQKSRSAAAIALGELGDSRAIPELITCLEAPNWELRYASLMGLEKLGSPPRQAFLENDPNWLVRAKAGAQ